MNGPIYDKLSATLPYLSIWDSQGDAVFDANNVDFMKPAIASGMQPNAVIYWLSHKLCFNLCVLIFILVEKLLTDTTLSVAVDNGQLDLICDTPCKLSYRCVPIDFFKVLLAKLFEKQN